MTSQSRHEFISKLKHYLVPAGEGVFTVHTASDKRESLQKKIQEIEYEVETVKVKENILKNFTYEDIARYAIASVMGEPIKIIKATKTKDLYFVSYFRKSDKKKFDYKIKFEGNQILWSNFDGRWRNSEYDEKISFEEDAEKLIIITTFSDMSKDIQEYKKGE